MSKNKGRGNGQGTVYKIGTKWCAEVTLGWYPDGRRAIKRKKGFSTKTDALDFLPKLSGSAIESPDVDINFMELYERWALRHYPTVSQSSTNGYKAAFKQCKSIYFRRFNNLRAKDLQEVVDACPNGRRSKADIRSLFNNMYKYAMENDISVKNYAQFIVLPPKGKSTNDAFSRSEVAKLWWDYRKGNKFTGHILTMIYSCCRYGDYASVLTKNVDLKKQYMIGGVKTDAGIDRLIPIADKIKKIVAENYDPNNKKLLTIPEKKFYEQYYETIRRVGVRELKPHCCRHTGLTLLAEKDAQPAIITAIAGHEDYSTTLNYTHISLKKMLATINSI